MFFVYFLMLFNHSKLLLYLFNTNILVLVFIATELTNGKLIRKNDKACYLLFCYHCYHLFRVVVVIIIIVFGFFLYDFKVLY